MSGGTQIQSIAIATTSSVSNNRIANVSGITYSYDAAGNVTNDGAHSYGYDGENRLVTVDAGSTASYVYDLNNWRWKKTSGGVATHCVWDGSQIIAEYNAGTGALVSEYIYAGSRLVAREQGGVTRYYLQDKLSTRMVTDSGGLVVGTMDHQPFGEDPLTGTGESEKHRFTSYERDNESNTDYAMNRQYHVGAGRFMRSDPYEGSYDIMSPQSLNRYSYVGNDPINYLDPSGLLRIINWSCASVCSTFGGVTNCTEECSIDSVLELPDPITIGPISPIDLGGDRTPQNPEPDPQKSNPNCIANAVTNGKGLARPFGNIAANGKIGHDGVHVVADKGSTVKTLPALAGVVLRTGRQDVGPTALQYVDVLLNGGNVAIYKDLASVNVKAGQRVEAGAVIGTTGGAESFAGTSTGGLHFTLLRGGRTQEEAYRALTRSDDRDKIKADLFINPLGPNSPVNCPGVPVNQAGITPPRP